MNYIISTEKNLLNVEKIWQLLKDCFWSKNIPREYIERFIKYSLCFGVYVEQEQVGFSRVVTDYTTYAYICDVIIDKNYRKKGLASALVQEILSHPELKGLKTWSLIATDESKNIYKKNGFVKPMNSSQALEISNLNIYCDAHFTNLHKDDFK